MGLYPVTGSVAHSSTQQAHTIHTRRTQPDPATPRASPYGDLPVMAALKTLVSKAHKAVKKVGVGGR